MKINRKKFVKLATVYILLLVVVAGALFYKTGEKIKSYNLTKPYEDLNVLEQFVVKIGGYPIYTRQQLVDKEAEYIVKTLKQVSNLSDLTTSDVINKEINECDKILDDLHNENSTGKITGDSLKVIMDNSISAVENHKKSLEAFKNGDLNTFSEFSKQVDKNAIAVRNEVERLGFKK